MAICPLYGGDCVGVDACAPAKFAEFKGEAGEIHRICPVVSITDALQSLAFSMEPLIRGLVGTPNPTPSVDSVGRDEFIKNVIRPEGRSS